jgi:multidrug efflux pump subunit AcrA (membrane-fusion protein)
LAGAYAHAWEALVPAAGAPMKTVRRFLSKSGVSLFVLACLMGLSLVPVPMSAIAPAEVVATDPMLVTAPIDGVVGELPVAPGTWVKKGTPVVRFVDVKLRNDVEAARRSRAVAAARYFKVMQSAMATQKDTQDLATAKAEMDLANAELVSATELLERSVVLAERAGLLIYSAKSEWIGKPVGTGERLMEIGDPASTHIQIELPVSDTITLRPDAPVSLFLDSDPLTAIAGKLTRTSYRPTQTAEQQLAFHVQATFNDGIARRIGVRGVAKISGDDVPLWLYLFRRPVTAIRQRIGL